MIDDSEFPIVYVRAQSDKAKSFRDGLVYVLAREKKFVLINTESEGERYPETQEQRREKAAFFKANRAAMGRLCLAYIVTPAASAELEARRATVGPALGLNFYPVADASTAVEAARSILSKVRPVD